LQPESRCEIQLFDPPQRHSARPSRAESRLHRALHRPR
jgi:hypothetical protein